MPRIAFSKNVFLNCPLDDEYKPILQAILFCIVYLGFTPRLATEQIDSGKYRLDKICELIEGSKYSIHDLSRCQAKEKDEYFRLNMPFELGIDYACRKYLGSSTNEKKILVLEEEKYRYKAALSDLSGCDIAAHDGKFDKAVRQVRNWLVAEAGARNVGANKICNAYTDFQEWHYKRQLGLGFSEEDIQDYPTKERLDAMQSWIDEGQPI